jgi:hypothetical protein
MLSAFGGTLDPMYKLPGGLYRSVSKATQKSYFALVPKFLARTV